MLGLSKAHLAMEAAFPDTTAPKPLVLYGAGSQAYVLGTILKDAGFAVVAVFNDWAPDPGYDAPAPVVVGRDAIEAWVRAGALPDLHYAISIGSHHGRARADAHRFLSALGLTPAALVSRMAYVDPTSTIGHCPQILPFAFVGARASLGDAVILNTRASVDHECRLADGVHIGPGATLCGRVTIGRHTFLGAGSVVCPDVSIAADTIIGAGAVVIRDISEPGTYVGVPARRVR